MNEYDVEYWLDKAVELTKDYEDVENFTARKGSKIKTITA